MPDALQIQGLNVFYGRSHALQGVDLVLPGGVLSVVGRNGMGKTTLCKAIMGLVPIHAGSIRFAGDELAGRGPAEIARLGLGYVPQGRRLWPSLTVDEHLRLVERRRGGAWSIERIYDTFPRLAERRGNGGRQLSGGEQQMLAISRALLMNPRLLVLDEPTEGLAPVIVAQVETMLHALAESGDMAVLVIEQNIGVATAISETVAIMVNGRVNRLIDAAVLAGDRELQQRLLGVGRHGEAAAVEPVAAAPSAVVAQAPQHAPGRIYLSNPVLPTRWSQSVPAARIEAAARTMTAPPAIRPVERASRGGNGLRPSDPHVIVAGTLDTKGEELRHLRDILAAEGLRVRMVDLSTAGRVSGADVPPLEIALAHPRGSAAVFSTDRGAAIAAMADAFRAWTVRQTGIVGIVGAGGSGGTALVAPAMRALPLGVPKIIVSTIASSDVRPHVGTSDIVMMPAVADVQGLNRVSREILGNAAHALAGMVRGRAARLDAERGPRRGAPRKPALGITMFGVTTPAVQNLTRLLDAEFECLVFHATGIGGQTMEQLVDGGVITAVADLTTTELCDLLMGGIHPATDDRLGAVIRTRIPYVGSVGALDMVNFAALATVPERYRGRMLHVHNPNVTLLRTTPEENARMGAWLGERLNRMEGPVRFLLPERGVSALDAPGQPFHDPIARAALFGAIEATVSPTPQRRVLRVPHHINDPAFAAAAAQAVRQLAPRPRAMARAS